MRSVLAAAVTIGAVLTPALADRGESTERAVSTAAQSPGKSAVARGRVVDDHGKPQEGVTVQLVAWPSVEELARQQPGEELPLRVLDTTVTDQSGSFEVGVDLDDIPLLSDATGVDVEVYVEGKQEPIGFSTAPGQLRNHLPPQALGDIKRNGPPPSTSAGGLIGSHRPAGQHSSPLGACTPLTTDLMSTSNLKTKLGEAHVSYLNAAASFTYTAGASSTLGYGVSVSGGLGTFSSGGTVTRSWSATITYPAVTTGQSRQFYTYFQYGKYRIKCYALHIGPADWWYQYEFRPIILWGGGGLTTISPRTSTKCTHFSAGMGSENSTTTAYTWSSGVASAGIIGINLSSRTGHSSSAKIRYKFNVGGQLCVIAGGSPSTAQIAVAKP